MHGYSYTSQGLGVLLQSALSLDLGVLMPRLSTFCLGVASPLTSDLSVLSLSLLVVVSMLRYTVSKFMLGFRQLLKRIGVNSGSVYAYVQW
jgi:hypothetical protein